MNIGRSNNHKRCVRVEHNEEVIKVYIKGNKVSVIYIDDGMINMYRGSTNKIIRLFNGHDDLTIINSNVKYYKHFAIDDDSIIIVYVSNYEIGARVVNYVDGIVHQPVHICDCNDENDISIDGCVINDRTLDLSISRKRLGDSSLIRSVLVESDGRLGIIPIMGITVASHGYI